VRTSLRRGILALTLILAPAHESAADIGVVILEPINALGFFTRVGHAGTYLSNICPDGSPIRMRLCRPGERGGVVSKYSAISEENDYDWAIVSLEQFLHGVDAPELAPLIGTPALHTAMQTASFETVFSAALDRTRDGRLPAGQWGTGLANRFARGIYILSIATTAADDQAIVDAFRTAPNKSRFNFFYDNCSNQTKAVFDLIMAGTDAIGDRAGGLTMQTPKGLAKTLVDRARARPDLRLRVERYPQVPGTARRSTQVLFPMENTYRNLSFAPYWYFGGFREVALGALLYHEVFSPFRLADAFEDFLSARAAELTVEQIRLRSEQDKVRRLLLQSAAGNARRRLDLEAVNGAIVRGLQTVKAEKEVEVRRILGSDAQWRSFDREFRPAVGGVDRHAGLFGELHEYFADFAPTGRLSEQLLAYFAVQGSFYIDEDGRGPWIRLPVPGVQAAEATGLSESQILTGSPRLAFLVLAAVIDHNLYETGDRREDLEHMERLFALFRQARRALVAPAVTY